MSSFIHQIAKSAPIARSVAIAALLGATMLAGPFAAARAEEGAVSRTPATAGQWTTNDLRAVCADRRFWKNADAAACIGAAYREGVRENFWDEGETSSHLPTARPR